MLQRIKGMQFICLTLPKCPPFPLSSLFALLYGDRSTALQKSANTNQTSSHALSRTGKSMWNPQEGILSGMSDNCSPYCLEFLDLKQKEAEQEDLFSRFHLGTLSNYNLCSRALQRELIFFYRCLNSQNLYSCQLLILRRNRNSVLQDQKEAKPKLQCTKLAERILIWPFSVIQSQKLFA